MQITGDFEEGEARSLARVLNRGAFPTDVEVRRVDTVSPTLGEDSMRASIFAGLVGIALLLVFLILFYRRLTLLIAAGMIVWGMLIYSVSILISQQTNYALTLAGVTGIIVSIGMTVDSYVVYFERMKDEVMHGRTFKNSAARSFKSTWRTILAANLVSFIAAAVLFVLSVGSVRGFALYLGVTTICDVIVLWFFTRPAVILMADTGRLDKHDPFGLGAASRLSVDDAPLNPRPASARSPATSGAASFARPRRRSTSGAGAGSGSASPALILLITVLSLWPRGLVLGIDFEGGVAWDVPAGKLTVDDARASSTTTARGRQAKIQERTLDSGDIIKVQVEDQPEDVRVRSSRRSPRPPASTGRRQRGVGQREWGEEITGRRSCARRVPRPDRRLHLVALRVGDGPARSWRWSTTSSSASASTRSSASRSRRRPSSPS